MTPTASTTWRGMLVAVAVVGACSAQPSAFTSCEEVATEAGTLLIAAADNVEVFGPEKGNGLVERIGITAEDGRIRARSMALQRAEANLDCGDARWADNQVADRLGEEFQARQQRLDDEGREPSQKERSAMNNLAIFQAALMGADVGVEVHLFD